jgi:hypothetical protein
MWMDMGHSGKGQQVLVIETGGGKEGTAEEEDPEEGKAEEEEVFEYIISVTSDRHSFH